jgi:hypothetical protein
MNVRFWATRDLIAAVAVTTSLLVGGCDLSGGRRCVVADGQEPLNGLTPEQRLEELAASEDSGWPDVPDGEWEREVVSDSLIFRNGGAEVIFVNDTLVSVSAC